MHASFLCVSGGLKPRRLKANRLPQEFNLHQFIVDPWGFGFNRGTLKACQIYARSAANSCAAIDSRKLK
jgi:hypothetical protein